MKEYTITFKTVKHICRFGKPSVEGFTCRLENNKSFSGSWAKCNEEFCPLIQEREVDEK